MYTVSIDFGSGAVDCTDYLVGQYPVKRSRSIHNNLKPVIGTCRFALHRNTALVNQFLTASTDPEVTILHDGAAFFKGTIRRTVRVNVGQIRVEGIECQCVDPLYRMESRLVRTSFTWSNYKISDPANKSASILHQLFYLAGYSDSELDFTEIATVVDRYSVDGTSAKVTVRGLIEDVLRDAVYSLRVTKAGIIELYDLFPATLTAVQTLSTGAGGNIAEGYGVDRDEFKAEAVDVTYWDHKTIADAVVFEDTTGRTASLPCSIPIAAGGYYPEGADASKSVRCVFEYPDYDIVAVDSPAVEWSHTGDVVKQVETIDGLGMLVRFYSATGGVITKLRVVGDATLKKTEHKVISEIVASSDERETLKSEIITSQADAERLSSGRAAWHKHSTFSYIFNRLTLDAIGSDVLHPSDTLFPATDLYPAGDILQPGDIVQITDANLLGASQLARVVRVDDGSDPKTFVAVCEGVGDYTETPIVGAPAVARPGVPMASQTGAADDAQARADAAEAAAVASAVALVPTYTPAYLGAHMDAAPTVAKNGDSYLRYSATSGTSNRGVFVFDGSTWARTTDPVYVYKALADIVWICQLKDTDGTTALYGTEADYGVDTSIQTAHIMAAIIDRLRVGDLELAGTLRSRLMDTVNPQAGETIAAPTPTYWPGSALVAHCAGLANGWHAATGTLDGKTVTHIVKSASRDVVLQADNAEEQGTSTTYELIKEIVSGAKGKIRLYVEHARSISIGRKGPGETYYNLIAEFPNYATYTEEYLDVEAGIGDTFGVFVSNKGFVKNFRLAPQPGTVAIWNSTDPSALIVDDESYYDEAGNVDETATLADFVTADYDTYWQGSELIAALSGKVTAFRTLPLGGGTFNGKTCSQIYYSPTLIQLDYVSGASDVIHTADFYNYTGSIVLDDVEGKILLGEESAEGQYELWSHNIPGSTDNILTIRNRKTGKVFSIWETRAPDASSGGTSESTFSLHGVEGSNDFVHDDSMHNYAGAMHFIDGFYNYGGSYVGDWKRVAKRTISTDWAASTSYTAGDFVKKSGKAYLCIQSGTTGTVGPSGTGAAIADGFCYWDYLGDVDANGVWEFLIARHYSLKGANWFAGGRIATGNFRSASTPASGIFSALAPFLAVGAAPLIISGSINGVVISRAERTNALTIVLYGASTGGLASYSITSTGSGTHTNVDLSW